MVSVLLPTYQRRKWACRAVRSVFAQRYTDWELIVVDDGSSDGTEEALAAFGPCLQYLWQENGGVSAARNAALRLARGEIVAFLDSDDRWLPDHLETVVGMLEHHPEAVLATTCPLFRIGGRQTVDQARLVDMAPMLFISNQTGYLPCVAVRRDALQTIGGFDERLDVGSDLMAYMRLSLLGPFSMLNRRTVVQQHTRGSLKERGVGRARYLAAWRLVAEEAVRCVPDRNDELAARANGALHYWKALDSLYQGRYAVARQCFARACEAWPELSILPHLVGGRLENITRDRSELLRLLSSAALVWPDPRSDTALFLRAQTALRALRAGRPRVAAGALGGWPLRDTPGFLRRTHSLWTRRALASVQRLVHRGREPVLHGDAAATGTGRTAS